MVVLNSDYVTYTGRSDIFRVMLIYFFLLSFSAALYWKAEDCGVMVPTFEKTQSC